MLPTLKTKCDILKLSNFDIALTCNNIAWYYVQCMQLELKFNLIQYIITWNNSLQVLIGLILGVCMLIQMKKSTQFLRSTSDYELPFLL